MIANKSAQCIPWLNRSLTLEGLSPVGSLCALSICRSCICSIMHLSDTSRCSCPQSSHHRKSDPPASPPFGETSRTEDLSQAFPSQPVARPSINTPKPAVRCRLRQLLDDRYGHNDPAGNHHNGPEDHLDFVHSTEDERESPPSPAGQHAHLRQKGPAWRPEWISDRARGLTMLSPPLSRLG